jgi:hypothetical protein
MKHPNVSTATCTGEGGTPYKFSTVSLTKYELEVLTYLLLTPTLNKFTARTPGLQRSSDIHDESFSIFPLTIKLQVLVV